MGHIKKEFKYGDNTITLETGVIARQATSAVLATMGGSVVLATVVAKKEANPDASFFPLSVHYQEKTYSAGKIPGGFFKREGRASEKETLTSRLIDRPIRPLFPEGFNNEVQVIATVMSIDGENDTDILAMIATSAALCISGVPFNGPIGAAKVAYIDGDYVLNPTFDQLENTDLNLVVAGTESAVLMVESEANQLSEQIMLEAVMFGHKEQQVVIQNIKDFASQVDIEKIQWEAPKEDKNIIEKVKLAVAGELAAAYQITEKAKRREAIQSIKENILVGFVGVNEENQVEQQYVESAFSKLEKEHVREIVLADSKRIDGRALNQVRPISIQVGFLPRTHGSALFTRGETQAIVVTTLGTERDSQIIDALEGERKEPFMLHYNFPPFCVGETGMMSGPKRREIGHGVLAKRALKSVMPKVEEFPYSIRIVSEITESNGSSSMASVCGGSLSLMDAGVPLKAPVAGIAMGLVKESDRFAVLSDILGDEDHLGDMDFKVAGTEFGITALQMDIKIDGITHEIMEKALAQAREGRIHILGEMAKVITESRQDVSEFAPRLTTFQINPEKIKDVIGKGGATIRSIIDETGVTVDISDDGTVKVSSVDDESSKKAIKMIENLVAEPELNNIYQGKVTRILDFGAIVSFMPNKDGLVHISEIAPERIEKVSDRLEVGQEVKVKLIEIDRMGRIRLSIKQALDA